MVALEREPEVVPPKPVKIKINYVQKKPAKVVKKGEGKGKLDNPSKPDFRKILPPPAAVKKVVKEPAKAVKPAVAKKKGNNPYSKKIAALNKFSDSRYATKKNRRKEFVGKTSAECYGTYIGFGFYWDSLDQVRGYITGVVPGYPAYFAGIQPGDYIVFPQYIHRNAVLGETYSVVIRRGKYTFRELLTPKEICI